MSEFIDVARRPDIVRRSFRVALVVGTILVMINYFDRLFTGTLGSGDFAKMALTYCVPYCVSTYGAVSAVLAGRSDSTDG